VEVLQSEWATFLQDLHQQRFQMFGGTYWMADYPDPANFLDFMFHTNSSNNYGAYTNVEVDRLLELARVEQDQKTRQQLYHRIEEMILQDAPLVPLWHGGDWYLLVKPYVKDLSLSPFVRSRLKYAYMTEKGGS